MAQLTLPTLAKWRKKPVFSQEIACSSRDKVAHRYLHPIYCPPC